jgi:hypothetical protein
MATGRVRFPNAVDWLVFQHAFEDTTPLLEHAWLVGFALDLRAISQTAHRAHVGDQHQSGVLKIRLIGLRHCTHDGAHKLPSLNERMAFLQGRVCV